MSSSPSKDVIAIDNPHPERDYEIRCETPELTCICPVTGQPDFATVVITYVPDQKIVELKSLKLYVTSFRDTGAFHEAVTNQILDDLVALLLPRFLRLTAAFNVRGGIYTSVIVEHRQINWSPARPVELPPAISR